VATRRLLVPLPDIEEPLTELSGHRHQVLGDDRYGRRYVDPVLERLATSRSPVILRRVASILKPALWIRGATPRLRDAAIIRSAECLSADGQLWSATRLRGAVVR